MLGGCVHILKQKCLPQDTFRKDEGARCVEDWEHRVLRRGQETQSSSCGLQNSQTPVPNNRGLALYLGLWVCSLGGSRFFWFVLSS